MASTFFLRNSISCQEAVVHSQPRFAMDAGNHWDGQSVRSAGASSQESHADSVLHYLITPYMQLIPPESGRFTAHRIRSIR